MPDPLLGFSLQSFSLSCSRTPFPAPLPSCRWSAFPDQPVPTSHDASATLRRFRLALSDGPRLQGLAPHESPPLFTGGLDRHRARGSLGFSTLQGSLSRWRSQTFACLPLTGLPSRSPKRPFPAPLRVSPPTRLAGLSQDCRPSWALRPHDLHERLVGRGSGVASSSPGVRHRPLSDHL
jgi:hypothetical protein